jgi:low affinity Fe/Cu permease
MLRTRFRKFSHQVAEKSGTVHAFGISLAIFVAWLATGPYFGWSDAHHLWLDITISVTPFWMVFILQATQNRDSALVEAKLDELLRAISEAREDLVGVQDNPERDLRDCDSATGHSRS